MVPPECLPRRAVRGLGAHSPHQTGSLSPSLRQLLGSGEHSLLEFENTLSKAAGQSHLCPEVLSKDHDEFLEFEGETLVLLQQNGRIAGE